jgi:hypothetical protein
MSEVPLLSNLLLKASSTTLFNTSWTIASIPV